MPADKDRKALKLFSASMSIAEIRDELGFRDVSLLRTRSVAF